MNFRLPALAAALSVLAGCVEINYNLGADYLPAEQTYSTNTITIELDDIDMVMVDSLSGFSQTQLAVGAIMDEDGIVTTRSAALTLTPIYSDSLDFGKDPVFRRFHMSLAADSVSVSYKSDARLLQTVNVRELLEPISADKNYDCNGKVSYSSYSICNGCPIVNGKDSLTFDFTQEYAEKFFALTKDDMSSWEKYTAKIPGIYFYTDRPTGLGGRYNIFEVQFGYDTNSGYVTGNCAQLDFNAEYNGERKDTSILFYFGGQKLFKLDSLMANGVSIGNMPEFSLNLTGEEEFRKMEGKATDKIIVAGGGGIKPRIKAKYLRKKVYDVMEKLGHNPKEILLNKCSLYFAYEFPDDMDRMYLYPDVLSPTTRIQTDTTTTFVNLTDNSSTTENAGDINRVYKCYSPDFSYHMQSILTVADSLITSDHDVWMLLMAYNSVTTDTSNSDYASMYQQLAYQSYYNQMYSGAGGYSSLDSYSNYYSYMMMAQYYANSSTTEKVLSMDNIHYYKFWFYGPTAQDPAKRPKLIITYSYPTYSIGTKN